MFFEKLRAKTFAAGRLQGGKTAKYSSSSIAASSSSWTRPRPGQRTIFIESSFAAGSCAHKRVEQHVPRPGIEGDGFLQAELPHAVT